MPLQGITNTGGAIRRSQQPLHWVYPQPQQQHHQQRSAWNNHSLSISSSMANNSLDLTPTIHAQCNSGSASHSLVGNSSLLDASSSQILGTSGGPPPSIKNGVLGSNSSSVTTSDNDDEWKNIHVVRV